MRLMTAGVAAQLPPLRSTDGRPDTEVMVYVHYYTRSWDWWAIEHDPETQTFYGLVRGFVAELGHFSLEELEEVRRAGVPFGWIERDLHWEPKSLAEVRKELAAAGVV